MIKTNSGFLLTELMYIYFICIKIHYQLIHPTRLSSWLTESLSF